MSWDSSQGPHGWIRDGAGGLCCPSPGCAGAGGWGVSLSQVPTGTSIGVSPMPALGKAGCCDFTGHLSLLRHLGGVQIISGFLCGFSLFWFFSFMPCSPPQQAKRRRWPCLWWIFPLRDAGEEPLLPRHQICWPSPQRGWRAQRGSTPRTAQSCFPSPSSPSPRRWWDSSAWSCSPSPPWWPTPL